MTGDKRAGEKAAAALPVVTDRAKYWLKMPLSGMTRQKERWRRGARERGCRQWGQNLAH